jgi:hypothetical protein
MEYRPGRCEEKLRERGNPLEMPLDGGVGMPITTIHEENNEF